MLKRIKLLINRDDKTTTIIRGNSLNFVSAVASKKNTVSDAVGPVDPAPTTKPLVVTPPSITGNTTTGSLLTLSVGTASGNPSPTASIQWLRAGSAISGSTGNTYTLVAADEGKVITARVTWTNSVGTAVYVALPSGGTTNPGTTGGPVFTPIPRQDLVEGRVYTGTLSPYASSPAGPLNFTATGLPPGVTMTPFGILGGRATATGTFTATVTAIDPDEKASQTTVTFVVVASVLSPSLPALKTTPVQTLTIDKAVSYNWGAKYDIYLPNWGVGPKSMGDPSKVEWQADGSVILKAARGQPAEVSPDRSWYTGSMQVGSKTDPLNIAAADVHVTDPSAVAAFFGFADNQKEVDFELTNLNGVIAWSPGLHMPNGSGGRVSATRRTVRRAPWADRIQKLEYRLYADRCDYYCDGVIFETIYPSDMAAGAVWDVTTPMNLHLEIEEHESWAGWNYASGKAEMRVYRVGPSSAWNLAPVVDVIPALSATVGSPFNFTATATDPEGGTLTWTWAGLPAGVTANGATISGTPTSVVTANITATATDVGGRKDSKTATLTVAAAPVTAVAPTVGVPTISGTAAVGQTLTATGGAVTGTPAPTTAWQWLRNGAAISGATSATYVVVAADQGTSITVTQTATNSAGSASATSAVVTIPAAGTAGTAPPEYVPDLTSGRAVPSTLGPDGLPIITPATFYAFAQDELMTASATMEM